MKKLIQIFSVISLLFLLSTITHAYTIGDNYWGGYPSDRATAGDRDVVGSASRFDILGMNVVFDNGTMVVDIYSRYFNNVGIDGTQLGDLFISTDGWNPYGNPPYVNDYGNSGEEWEYVAVLNYHFPSDLDYSGSFSLYKIGNGGTIRFTDSYYSGTGYNYRRGQEVAFIPAASPVYTGGSWSTYHNGTYADDTDDYLRLVIDYTKMEGAGPFGFHWTTSCGNDVIEGLDDLPPVPEPATMLLLGSGLIGLSFGLRKKWKK